ncbi:MAG TPA: energy transducer TonB [Gemmatimonadales bacterium]|nr:energy transducer TonB [Gemmatimonadales bacterium]
MRRAAALLALGAGLACTRGSGAGATPTAGSPVALDADTPVRYPPELFDRAIDGDVVLRLFVDASGRLVPESTTIATSSGYAAFDSAAVHGASQMRFAPGQRHGVPVAMAFLQPIRFRHTKGSPR